jgi:hypothetical protein
MPLLPRRRELFLVIGTSDQYGPGAFALQKFLFVVVCPVVVNGTFDRPSWWPSTISSRHFLPSLQKGVTFRVLGGTVSQWTVGPRRPSTHATSISPELQRARGARHRLPGGRTVTSRPGPLRAPRLGMRRLSGLSRPDAPDSDPAWASRRGGAGSGRPRCSRGRLPGLEGELVTWLPPQREDSSDCEDQLDFESVLLGRRQRRLAPEQPLGPVRLLTLAVIPPGQWCGGLARRLPRSRWPF